MLKVKISYPDKEAERLMLQNWQLGKYSFAKAGADDHQKDLKPVVSAQEILDCQNALNLVKVEESVLNYLLELITKSRTMPDLQLGGSPRAALNWLAAARAHAALSGQDYVTPDNIKHVAEAVLSHRLVLTPEAELEGLTAEQVTANLLKQIPVPR